MRAGVDTGGTFTDLVAVDEGGALRVHKLASTADDPARAVLDGLARIAAGARVDEVVHGTTVATNALLTRTGGPTALVATRGFEDLLVVRRQARPRLYALEPRVPPPLVPAALRYGLDERLGPDGQVLRAPDTAALDALAERLREAIDGDGVRSIAVALLHSYASDRHERLVAARLASLGVPLSLSSEVLPEHREYERTSTTVVDAYVAPPMRDYLGRLAGVLGESLRVMQSSGGAASAEEARRHPVRTILSGPAAGVVGARAAARHARIEGGLVTFDMGGTSTDVALVDGERELELDSEGEVDGHPVRVSSLRVHTVGAGGGSIAWRDEGGALKVGPRSAGAQPGPASYGRGGGEATVTDAALVLGRLHAAHFLGGAMRLDEGAALRAIETLARRLGLGASETAAGIARVATAVMARAIRVISVERGRDPRDFTLVPFGGAGGLFACDVAAELGMARCWVPPAPGLLCAYGALVADVTRDHAATRIVAVAGPLEAASLAGELAPLEAAAHAGLDAEGIPPARRALHRMCDLRYAGQSYELSIALPEPGAAPFDLAAAFHAEHARRYGFADRARPVERVALRVHARGLTPPPPPLALAPEAGPSLVGDLTGVPVHARARLAAGARIDGPAVVVELSATTWVARGWSATVDAGGGLHLARA